LPSQILSRRAAAGALLALLTVTLPLPAVAQEGSGDGIEFPAALGAGLLEAETLSGAEWLARYTDGEGASEIVVERTQALLEGVGASVDDLTVKSALYEPAPGNTAAVVALRVAGTDARDFTADAASLLLGDIDDPTFVLRPFGDKWSVRVADPAMPGRYPSTIYLEGDTAWVIEGDEQYVAEALRQLSDPAPVGALAGDSLITELPITLGERRRIGLFEALEPFSLPTMTQRLGPELDAWLIDLYLEAGVSPTEVLGVDAWWGLASPADSIEIEGYRVPEAVGELLERLRTEIFLGQTDEPASFAGLFEGVERIDEQIGGRDVSTLDYGFSRQHVFRSDDTIWIVTDHAGQPELAAEAIAALP
jgi:hypothetical protein